VGVVWSMTSGACLARSILEGGVRVAIGAGDLGVAAGKGKRGIAVVIEGDGLPVARGVAGATARPVAPLMLVVLGMAGVAGRWRWLVPERAGMTGLASCRGMTSVQSEPGIAAVIEDQAAPGGGDVATLAAFAVASAMGIIGGVASVAGFGRVREAIVGVAAFAENTGVGTAQREAGAVMIEAGPRPGRWVVAVSAAWPQAALVAVILAMAFDTGGRCIAKFSLGRVAGTAGGLLVCAQQGKVGIAVVERLALQGSDLCRATLVIGVTGPALGRARRVMTAVKTLPLADIGGDVLVTGEAEAGLCLLVERGMATATILLQLHV